MKKYKDRQIDPETPVEVYRCLTKPGVVYSVRQGGKVVAHAKKLLLRNVECVVSQSGYQRYKETGKRTHHAFLRGDIVLDGKMMHTGKTYPGHFMRISYNPECGSEFMAYSGYTKPRAIAEALSVCINGEKITGRHFTFKTPEDTEDSSRL